MKGVLLVVFPDHTWSAESVGGITARGTWRLSSSHVASAVVDGASSRRRSAKERRRDEMLCRAVASLVHAMKAQGESS